MKKQLFILVTTVALCLYSCTQKSSINSNEDLPVSALQRANEDTDSLNLRTYIKNNPNLFGLNVVIFDSIAQADEWLETFSESDYKTMRAMYNSLWIHSDILESNIVYDSVLYSTQETFGTDIDDTCCTEEKLDIVMESFKETMNTHYSNYCEATPAFDEKDTCYHGIRTIGEVDLAVFCNDKNLFVAGDVVFCFKQGYLLTCHVYTYERLARYTDLDSLSYYIDIDKLENINGDEFILFKMNTGEDITTGLKDIVESNNNSKPQYTDNNYTGIFKENNGNYSMTASLTVYPYWFFHTRFRSKLCVTNYYKDSKKKQTVSGRYDCEAVAWNNYDGYWTYNAFFMTHHKYLMNAMGTERQTGFKQHTFPCTNYAEVDKLVSKTYLDLQHYTIYLKSENDVEISKTK